jgi:transcription elongation GreA/GreB family factor
MLFSNQQSGFGRHGANMRASLPEIFIPRSERRPLKKLLAKAFRNRDRLAGFLSAEVRRANYCDDTVLPEDCVAVGRLVSYRLDWSTPTPYRALVYPKDLRDPEAEISLLSPIGTALLGLRRGDEMLVFLPGDGFHKLTVEGVLPSHEAAHS